MTPTTPEDLEAVPDPDDEAKRNRILHLYAPMDGTADAEPDDPELVMRPDEFGPLNLHPIRVGSGPTAAAAGGRPTNACIGVGHLLAVYDLSRDRVPGHVKPRKRRGEFRTFCRYVPACIPQGPHRDRAALGFRQMM
jgi:hypothetical protein